MSVLPKSAPHAHEAQRRPWAYTGYTHAEKAEPAYSLARWRLDGSGQCEIRAARTVSRSAFPSPSTNLLYSTSQSPFSAFTIVAVAQASEKPSSEDRTSTLSPEANFFSSFMGGCGQRSVRASKFGKVEHLRRSSAGRAYAVCQAAAQTGVGHGVPNTAFSCLESFFQRNKSQTRHRDDKTPDGGALLF